MADRRLYEHADRLGWNTGDLIELLQARGHTGLSPLTAMPDVEVERAVEGGMGAEEVDESRITPPEELESDLDELADIELPEPGEEVRWRELAQRFMPLIMRAARGDIGIDTHQRQLLQQIMDRGFGKAGTERIEDVEVGVVVLPALYDDQRPVEVCPRCESTLVEAKREAEEGDDA